MNTGIASLALLALFISSAPALPAQDPAPNTDESSARSIWVDKGRQRVYGLEGSRLVFEAICSTAAHHPHWAPGDDRYLKPVTPVGDYRIFSKEADHYSRTYNVHMRYALFYDGGRALHATYPSEYRYLGAPASGGCVRMTRAKAIELFRWAQVGDPVYVVSSLPEGVHTLVEIAHPRPVLVLRNHRAPLLRGLGLPRASAPSKATPSSGWQMEDPQPIAPEG